jgi:hypothetical protein
MLHRLATSVFVAALLSLCANTVLAADWIFDNGPYTRSATTGKRVDRYKALPKVDRIPFEKFFSEDGPHPGGLDWWTDWGWMGEGYGGWGWGGADMPYGGWGENTAFTGPYIYPWGAP